MKYFSETLMIGCLGDVCCYRGVCPTAERCNACIRGLRTDSLSHFSRLLCMKFWGDKCHGRKRSACHFYEPNEVFYASTDKADRFNCQLRGNTNCIASEMDELDCHCERRPTFSQRLDDELEGKHYVMEKANACLDLKRLASTTRVKLHPRIGDFCERPFFVNIPQMEDLQLY